MKKIFSIIFVVAVLTGCTPFTINVTAPGGGTDAGYVTEAQINQTFQARDEVLGKAFAIVDQRLKSVEQKTTPTASKADINRMLKKTTPKKDKAKK